MTIEDPRPLSDAQADFIFNSVARVNIARGPVRAGKNYAENIRVKTYLKTEPYNNTSSRFLFAGPSKDAVLRNFLDDLFAIAGKEHYRYSESSGKGVIFGRKFFVAGFGDEAAFKKIQGGTFGGALITEAQLAPENFIDTTLARCSIDGACIFMDCNAAGPQHFLYKRFLDNQDAIASGTISVFRFNFEDSNRSLSQAYRDYLKELYVPGSLIYQRMIEDKWVAADGIIYTAYNEDRHLILPKDIPVKGTVSVPFDYGASSPCVFGELLKNCNVYYIVSEKRHHGAVDGQKTNAEYISDLKEYISGFRIKPSRIILDPAPISSAFNEEIRRNFPGIPKTLADTDVLDGIALVNNLLYTDRLKIATTAKHTREGFGVYVWDRNAANRGEDKPLKKDDHEMDMLRYGVKTSEGSAAPVGRGWKS